MLFDASMHGEISHSFFDYNSTRMVFDIRKGMVICNVFIEERSKSEEYRTQARGFRQAKLFGIKKFMNFQVRCFSTHGESAMNYRRAPEFDGDTWNRSTIELGSTESMRRFGGYAGSEFYSV